MLAIDFDSILVPPGEDFGLKSDDEDLYGSDNVELDSGLSNVIVIDNIPVVPREKFGKLEAVIKKIYSQIGVIKEDGFWMPVDPHTHKTLGYCFIEFNTPQEAELALKSNGYKLDRSHIFAVNLFDDFDRFMKVLDEWVPPEIKPYTPGENLISWLSDESRDQFVIRAGTDTEICWNSVRQPDLVYKRTFWTEDFVQWSPLGTYLATIHRQGAAVWGGASIFNRLMRYAHPQAELIDFSPGENYLVTYSCHEPSSPDEPKRVVINIFDVRTGKVKRDFMGTTDEFAIPRSTGGVSGVSWPVFKWGGGRNDKYFARLRKNLISIYETGTFSLIDKKSLKVENVMDFSWSPTDPILALFVPEMGGGNQPARVSLYQIPDKMELRQINLFNVSDCCMYWQSNGDYLAVKIVHSTYSCFDLFRIKERDIPIEVVHLDSKSDKIIAFAWEPKGHRFAVIHGDSPRPDISFYSMRSGRVLKLVTLKGKQANSLFWSPAGRFIILAGLKGMNCQLEFFNVDDLEIMATAEHFMATNIDWDPTGRYVAISVTSAHEIENGFNIWSFNGKLLYRILKDNFLQFLWRPRPPSFLSPEKEEEIAKKLRKYSKKYEAEDQDVSKQEREKRRMLKNEWNNWVSDWKRLREETGDVEEEDYQAEEVEVEEFLETTEEVID